MLPSPFRFGRAHAVAPDRKAEQHGIVGKVEVDIDVNAAEVLYGVFSTAKGALASWREEKLPGGTRQLRTKGLPQLTLLFHGVKRIRARSGAWASADYFAVTFISGNVIAEANIIVPSHTGSVPTQLLPLALLAFHHLQNVRQRLMP